MRPDGSKVGGTSGFLQLPHSYPSSASQVAANNREIERVVNQIPIADSPSLIVGLEGADLDDGHSSSIIQFTPAGRGFYTAWADLVISVASDSKPDIRVWGQLNSGISGKDEGYHGPHTVAPLGSEIAMPLGPKLVIGGVVAYIDVRWDGNSAGSIGSVAAGLALVPTTNLSDGSP